MRALASTSAFLAKSLRSFGVLHCAIRSSLSLIPRFLSLPAISGVMPRSSPTGIVISQSPLHRSRVAPRNARGLLLAEHVAEVAHQARGVRRKTAADHGSHLASDGLRKLVLEK